MLEKTTNKAGNLIKSGRTSQKERRTSVAQQLPVPIKTRLKKKMIRRRT